METHPLAPFVEPAQPLSRPGRAALWIGAHVLFYASAALLAGLVLLYCALAAAVWFAGLAVPYMAGFLFKCALVIAGIFGVALVFPAAGALVDAVPALRDYWPLALAVAAPVPLALLVDRVFFRR